LSTIDLIKAAWQAPIGCFKAQATSLPSIELPARAKNLVEGEAAPTASHGATGSSGPSSPAPAGSSTTAKLGGEIIVRAERGTDAKIQSVNLPMPLVQDRGTVIERP